MEMNHISNPTCDVCGCKVPKMKNLKKICGTFYCVKCAKEKRLAHREITREYAGIRKREDILRDAAERRSRRKVIVVKDLPKIKGQVNKEEKIRNKSQSYLTLEEKQNYFRILMRKGLTYDEACERMNKLVKEQRRVREYLKAQNKSEREIKKAEVDLMGGLLR